MLVLARFLRWLTWNPFRAIAALTLVVFLFVASISVATAPRPAPVGQLTQQGFQAPATLPGIPQSTSSPAGTDGPVESPDPTGKTQLLTAARGFMTAWLSGADTRIPTGTWVMSVGEWATPAVLPWLEVTNRSQIPTATVQAVTVVGIGETSGTVRFTLTNGQRIDVTVVFDGFAWKVANYQPVQGQ